MAQNSTVKQAPQFMPPTVDNRSETIVANNPPDISEEVLRKYVKGLPDNPNEFVDQVLRGLPSPVESAEALERLAAEAKFRDRWRSVIPFGFGLGFAPAGTVGVFLPPHINENLRKAIPVNLALTCLTSVLNQAGAGEFKTRGELGRKYLVSEDQAIKELYFLTFTFAYWAIRGIAGAANASPVETGLTRLWAGGVAAEAIFGLAHQLKYERRTSGSYPFLDFSAKPGMTQQELIEESRKRLISLQQGRLEASGGYFKDLGAGFDGYLGHIRRAFAAPETYATAIALLPSTAIGIAQAYLPAQQQQAKTVLNYLGDMAGPVGWMGRNLVQQVGTHLVAKTRSMFGYTRSSAQRDLESGTRISTEAPRLQLSFGEGSLPPIDLGFELEPVERPFVQGSSQNGLGSVTPETGILATARSGTNAPLDSGATVPPAIPTPAELRRNRLSITAKEVSLQPYPKTPAGDRARISLESQKSLGSKPNNSIGQ
jgi:hypothetical protein